MRQHHGVTSDPPFASLRRRAAATVEVLAALALIGLSAVGAEPPAPPPVVPPPSTSATPAPPLDARRIEELVAPVALYPDVVLDSLLPATTDPLGVVAAARHVERHGGGAVAAPAGVDWDPSVVAMLQFPAVLTWMSENLEWLEATGEAVATRLDEVLAAVQRCRERARTAGVLRTDEHQRVTCEDVTVVGAGCGIVIAPLEPAVVYVPVYDPWPLLDPAFAWPFARPFLTFGLEFRFGVFGAWAWHEIYWHPRHRHVGFHGEPWWWGRARPPGWEWGPSRPRVWTPPHRTWRRPGGTAGVPIPFDRGAFRSPRWTTGHHVVSGAIEPPSRRPDLAPRRSPRFVVPSPTTPVPRFTDRSWTWRRSESLRPTGPTPSWHLGDHDRVRRWIDRGSRSLGNSSGRSHTRRTH